MGKMSKDISLIEKEIVSRVDESKDEIIRFLQELVKVKSFSGTSEEGIAQENVASKLREIDGVKLEVWEPDPDELLEYPLYPKRLTPWSYKGRPNVIGILEGEEKGRSIILNGHIDVVSPEPVEMWKHDPFGAEIENDRLYGRGAFDMKGGLVALIYSIKVLRDLDIKLRGKVILESVVEEEFGGGGTLATILRGYTSDAAIIAESTGADKVWIGCGGSRFFKIKVTGKAVIPTIAHTGVNAIGLALKIYKALMNLNEERWLKLRGKHPLFEKEGAGRSTNMTIGVMKAGDWPATVAGSAELIGRIGFPPCEKGSDVEKQVEITVETVAKEDPWMKELPPKVIWWGARREAHEISLTEPIAQLIKHQVQKVVGKCSFTKSPVATDTSYITPVVGGYGGIPSVIYGPGGSGAHSSDEYVLINDVIDCTKVFALTLLNWCGADSD